ncbi:MAG: Flp family type IVb pilin [bacterium]
MNIKEFLKDENAVASIEYALIACLIAIAIIISLTIVGHRMNKEFKEIAKVLKKLIKRSRK